VSRNIFSYDKKHNALDAVMRFYIRLRYFDECLELGTESIDCFGRIGQILDHMAVCYETTGQTELAHKFFAESLSIDPEHQWAKAGVERTKVLAGQRQL
jgi:tetratricopeptide (TPR) repeat protein